MWPVKQSVSVVSREKSSRFATSRSTSLVERDEEAGRDDVVRVAAQARL